MTATDGGRGDSTLRTLDLAIVVVSVLTVIGPLFYDMPVMDAPQTFVNEFPLVLSVFALVPAAAVLLPQAWTRMARTTRRLVAAVAATLLFLTAVVPSLAVAEAGALSMMLTLLCWTAVATSEVTARAARADERTRTPVWAIVARVVTGVALASPFLVGLPQTLPPSFPGWWIPWAVGIPWILVCAALSWGLRWSYAVIGVLGAALMVFALSESLHWVLMTWTTGGLLLAVGAAGWELSVSSQPGRSAAAPRRRPSRGRRR